MMALLVGVPAWDAAAALPTQEEVFTGEYDWSDGGRDTLTATFVPTGEGRWDVTFHFRFDGRDNTWPGTATGSLKEGTEVTGTARYRSRRWTWAATLEDGVLRGSHTELRSRGKERRTGTFELSRE